MLFLVREWNVSLSFKRKFTYLVQLDGLFDTVVYISGLSFEKMQSAVLQNIRPSSTAAWKVNSLTSLLISWIENSTKTNFTRHRSFYWINIFIAFIYVNWSTFNSTTQVCVTQEKINSLLTHEIWYPTALIISVPGCLPYLLMKIRNWVLFLKLN